jgi:hypothetical protein
MVKSRLYAVEHGARKSWVQCPPFASAWPKSVLSRQITHRLLYDAPAIEKMQITFRSLMGAITLALLPGIVRADEPKPMQAQRLDLGSVAGVAYYTVEPDGFHVIATLAQDGDDGIPLRVEGVLNAGQSLKLSTPGMTGVQPVTITFERQGKKLVVRSDRK